MNESVRDLLRQGADSVERPQLDIGDLVAQAERRLIRRRVAIAATSAVAVAAIIAAGVALRPDDPRVSPAPPVPTRTPETPEPTPDLVGPSFFAAPPNSASTWIGAERESDIYLRRGLEPKRRIISTDADERCPAVSPDGSSLAYLSGPYDADGLATTNLVVVPLDSAGAPDLGSRRVLLRDAVSCARWSSDGRRLAVVADGQASSVTELPDELRVMTLDGKSRMLALVPAVSQSYNFAWSPDGDAVAYLTQDSVWVAWLEGGDPELFWRSTPTPDPDPYGVPLPGAPTSLWWLSTGELAVVVLSDEAAAGYPYVPEGPKVLHIIDVESKRHEKIPGIYEYAYGDLVWSPDDSQFALANEDGHHILVHDRVTGSTVEIRPSRSDLPPPQRLDVSKAWSINYVAWSPEGDRLLAGVQQGSDSSGPIFALLSMAPDGTSVEVLTPWTDKLYPR